MVHSGFTVLFFLFPRTEGKLPSWGSRGYVYLFEGGYIFYHYRFFRSFFFFVVLQGSNSERWNERWQNLQRFKIVHFVIVEDGFCCGRTLCDIEEYNS